MSETSHIEMLHGIENPAISETLRQRARRNDARKLEIARAMNARWLTYPCSKMDDTYSRLDMTLRFDGPESGAALEAERLLEQTSGISRGDARHAVSWLFGRDVARLDHKPDVRHFVTEDDNLRAGLGNLQRCGRLRALAGALVVSVPELCAELWR